MKHWIDADADAVENLRLDVQKFGFAVLSNPIVPSVLRDLQEEAEQGRSTATFADKNGVKYRAGIVPLGPMSLGFLRSRQVMTLLQATFSERFVLNEHRSCLTLYKQGDFLGPHLDEPPTECVVTIITCVAATAPTRPSRKTGLKLHVYGRKPGPSCKPSVTFPTRTGAIVIGRGSRFWHERPVLKRGEHVAVLTACYKVSQ
jgi:hypothetical protein